MPSGACLHCLCLPQQVGGALLRGIAGAAQHLRQLAHPQFALERPDGCHRAPLAHDLLDLQVLVAEGGQLGKVGDAQDLVLARQAPEFLAHHGAHPSADALIDFVEDQRRGAVGTGQDALQAEHQA